MEWKVHLEKGTSMSIGKPHTWRSRWQFHKHGVSHDNLVCSKFNPPPQSLGVLRFQSEAMSHCRVFACVRELLLLLLEICGSFNAWFPTLWLAPGLSQLHHEEGQHDHGTQKSKHGNGLTHFLIIATRHYTWKYNTQINVSFLSLSSHPRDKQIILKTLCEGFYQLCQTDRNSPVFMQCVRL